jgi:hypothetical protein
MTHPSQEQLVAYLYKEVDWQDRIKLGAHIRQCRDCRNAVDKWRKTRADLDSWRVTPVTARLSRPAPVLRWAIAALVILAAGIGLGRFWAVYDLERVRAAVAPEIRNQLRSELAQIESRPDSRRVLPAAVADETRKLVADSVRKIEDERKSDLEAISSALSESDSRRLGEFLMLKKELDTVAQNTALGLSRTRGEISDLVTYIQPKAPSNPPLH